MRRCSCFILGYLLTGGIHGTGCLVPSQGEQNQPRPVVEKAMVTQAEPRRHAFTSLPTHDPDMHAARLPQVRQSTRLTASKQPRPRALTRDDVSVYLEEARVSLRALGIRRTASSRPPRGLHDDLRQAYQEHRAQHIHGTFRQVRQWMSLAKFGHEHPSSTSSRGPLVRYDLAVTTSEDHAWLHFIVPAQGLASATSLGNHYAQHHGKRWVALADHLRPGVDFYLFKRTNQPSLSRQWGEKNVIVTLAGLARDYQDRTSTLLGIGDISEVTGGKISDHWTHKRGVDADLYLLRFGDTDETLAPQKKYDEGPVCVWHTLKSGRSIWSTGEHGKKGIEVVPSTGGETLSARRLRVLATLVLQDDTIAYFVHNDPTVLKSFDQRAGERVPGRRFLHAENRAYWPPHRDHVHLRWDEGPLPVGTPPRP